MINKIKKFIVCFCLAMLLMTSTIVKNQTKVYADEIAQTTTITGGILAMLLANMGIQINVNNVSGSDVVTWLGNMWDTYRQNANIVTNTIQYVLQNGLMRVIMKPTLKQNIFDFVSYLNSNNLTTKTIQAYGYQFGDTIIPLSRFGTTYTSGYGYENIDYSQAFMTLTIPYANQTISYVRDSQNQLDIVISGNAVSSNSVQIKLKNQGTTTYTGTYSFNRGSTLYFFLNATSNTYAMAQFLMVYNNTVYTPSGTLWIADNIVDISGNISLGGILDNTISDTEDSYLNFYNEFITTTSSINDILGYINSAIEGNILGTLTGISGSIAEQTGIISTIKNGVISIVNYLNNIFVIDSTTITTAINQTLVRVNSHTGILTFPISLTTSFLSTVLTYTATDWIITFPSLPLINNTATSLNVSQMVRDNTALNNLYNTYISILDGILAFWLVNLLIRKSKEVFGN